jgi:hypothetical protein
MGPDNGGATLDVLGETDRLFRLDLTFEVAAIALPGRSLHRDGGAGGLDGWKVTTAKR